MYSPKIVEKIKEFEDFSAEPYDDKCSYKQRPRKSCSGTPTIGYGTTMYPDGTKVTLQDQAIDKNKATEYLKNFLNTIPDQLKILVNQDLNQNQVDALVSFIYNLGIGTFKNSEMLKKINKNPNDPTIKDEFLNFASFGGVENPFLKKRREFEKNLYATPVKKTRWVNLDEPLESTLTVPATQSVPFLGWEEQEVYEPRPEIIKKKGKKK